jgi:hypothetical protein
MASHLQRIISLMYREKISIDQAQWWLKKKLKKKEMAEFIVDAFNRGWISKFNLGLNEDGEII